MDKDFLQELFAPFADVTIKPMFGEIGIFHRGLNFAGVMGGVLRLKGDELTRAGFEAEGMEPWHYTYKSGRVVTMGYWQVPDRLLEDPEEFESWARDAFNAALRADAAKPAKQQKLEQF